MPLAADRDTLSRINPTRRHFPMGAAKKVYLGGIVVLASAGNAEAGSTATGKVAVGRAAETVDNSAGSAGDLGVEVEIGTFQYANSASADLITTAQIGSNCYIVDDQTVAKTDASGTRSVGGVIFDVDANGVWVTFK
jgi:hypothetical protein